MKASRKDPFILTAVAAALLLAFGPAMAQDDVAQLTKPESTVNVGVGYVDKDNQRFGQYNGLTDKGAYGIIDFSLNKRDDSTGTWFRLQGRNLGFKDPDLHLEQRRQGDWGYYIDYSRIPRYEPYTVNTGLQGLGSTSQTVVADHAGRGHRLPAEHEARPLDARPAEGALPRLGRKGALPQRGEGRVAAVQPGTVRQLSALSGQADRLHDAAGRRHGGLQQRSASRCVWATTGACSTIRTRCSRHRPTPPRTTSGKRAWIRTTSRTSSTSRAGTTSARRCAALSRSCTEGRPKTTAGASRRRRASRRPAWTAGSTRRWCRRGFPAARHPSLRGGRTCATRTATTRLRRS